MLNCSDLTDCTHSLSHCEQVIALLDVVQGHGGSKHEIMHCFNNTLGAQGKESYHLLYHRMSRPHIPNSNGSVQYKKRVISNKEAPSHMVENGKGETQKMHECFHVG